MLSNSVSYSIVMRICFRGYYFNEVDFKLIFYFFLEKRSLFMTDKSFDMLQIAERSYYSKIGH